MNTSSDLDQRHEVDSYDDKSFYKQRKGSRTGPKEPGGANEFPATAAAQTYPNGWYEDPFAAQSGKAWRYFAKGGWTGDTA
jgi:hypothetical protein